MFGSCDWVELAGVGPVAWAWFSAWPTPSSKQMCALNFDILPTYSSSAALSRREPFIFLPCQLHLICSSLSNIWIYCCNHGVSSFGYFLIISDSCDSSCSNPVSRRREEMHLNCFLPQDADYPFRPPTHPHSVDRFVTCHVSTHQVSKPEEIFARPSASSAKCPGNCLIL